MKIYQCFACDRTETKDLLNWGVIPEKNKHSYLCPDCLKSLQDDGTLTAEEKPKEEIDEVMNKWVSSDFK